MNKLFLFLLFISYSSFAQQIQISGVIKDSQNRGIESASVVVSDINQNTLAYSYTDENGKYSLDFEKKDNTAIIVTVSCLGFYKKENQTELNSKTNYQVDFIIEENNEVLKEVVIESHQKIKIDQDTTTIKVASFSNKTEQTIEDILKKLPGIEVLSDGSIKAHGKPIDKLLIEGDDLFDKNYKILSKNLDAKVLDAVQIIDNFEDNPILKKLSGSDKVALNLKLKADKQNIWFGNVTAGAGVVSENRWKESLNLGLLKKNIKLFYLADYNNSGEKATDQISQASIELNSFGEDRIEKTAKNFFNINSNENSSFSKSQSIFNKAFFNSLSFTKKIKPNITLRGVGYFANDHQMQDSFSETVFNIQPNPITNTEISNYDGNKTLSSGELELKYYINEKNYLTNIFIYKNNKDKINADLFFNESQVDQYSNDRNETFYNHLNHTYKLSETKVLINYMYFGNDRIAQKSHLISPLLNNFLNTQADAKIRQNANNKAQYFGIKSKLVSTYKKLEHLLGLQFENNNEILNNDFFINENQNIDYTNFSNLKQNVGTLENSLRYNFNNHIDFTASLNLIQNNFESNFNSYEESIINPRIAINLKRYSFGNINISYSENSNLPEINYLTNNFQLTDYRSFRKGSDYEGLLKNKLFHFSHTYFNDVKRFSLNTNFLYINSAKNYNTESNINENFNFSTYFLADGGESYNGSFSIVNYFRKLKTATKLETSQNWSVNPMKVNSDTFSNAENYFSSYKFSATTYFSFPLNFDFGFTYNFFKSTFMEIASKNETKDAFINANYSISKNWLAEINSTFYQMNNQNYSFVNAIINYTPSESRFSYRLIANNLVNENEFTLISVNDFTTYKSSINLVPRYILLTIKYRF